LKDGEEVNILPKDLGHSEIYAQNVKFSPNGRYFTLISEQDYVVHSTHKFVNSGFGNAVNFEWSFGQDYAVRTTDGSIKIFRNFTEDKSYKTDYENSNLFGGKLIGISGPDFISFYDWEEF
jgi:coatomer subunit beta'